MSPASTTIPLHRARGCLLGLAVGDAVGTAVEFAPRGSFPPVTDMTGGGPFDLPAGAWTDDTSMALCLADSLLARGGHDPRDQLARYVRWWRQGYRSSTGTCFDIGNTVRAALARFEQEGVAPAGSDGPRTAGNSAIMRLAPAVLFGFPDVARAVALAERQGLTTHAAPASRDACRLLGWVLVRLLRGEAKADVLGGDLAAGLAAVIPGDAPPLRTEAVAALARGDWRDKPRDAIRGGGYVVESLEAALWCVWTTASFRDAVLAAANLGDDADTTAAVTGQIAGALYGEAGIPATWRERVHLGAEIGELAGRLFEVGSSITGMADLPRTD